MTTTLARAAALLAALLVVESQAPAGDSPAAPPASLRCLEQDHDFTLNDLAGLYVALHLIPEGAALSPTSDAATLDDYHARAADHAGLIHLFITSAPDADARAWWGQRPINDRLMLVQAPASAIGSLLGDSAPPDPGAPATIVLDPERREIVRLTAPQGQRIAPFADFSRALAAAWRTTAIDQYNLPKDEPLAVQGYDVVSYLAENKAAKGQPQFTSTYEGVVYRFATAAHRAAFAASPRRYLPAYGGWCASAMGDGGRKVEIDPTNFKIKDGRTLLFYKSFFADALKDWNRNEKTWLPAADQYWKKLSGEEPAPAPAPAQP